MKTQNLTIKSGEHNLFAKLDLPTHKPKHLALFAHCFTCTSDLAIVRNISKSLIARGIGVLRFDFTGLGKSEGDFSDSTFSNNVSDLLNVYAYLSENYIAPDLLIGHSLGGAAVLMAAQQMVTVNAIITIGTPSNPRHVKHLFKESMNQINEKGKGEVNIGGRPFNITKEFINDLENNDLPAIVEDLRKPLLIMHSPQDQVVEIENASNLYDAAHHPKSFISLDGADHLLSNKNDAFYAADVLASWASRYLKKEEDEVTLDKGESVTHLLLKDGFTSDVYMSNHFLVADEPKKYGGEDRGPAPYDLINAGLGSCTAMTLKLYAERKKWDLQEVYVYLFHEKVSPDKVGVEPESGIKIDRFTKKIKLIGNLSQGQKERLLEISAKCPVHRTLTNKVIIESAILHD